MIENQLPLDPYRRQNLKGGFIVSRKVETWCFCTLSRLHKLLDDDGKDKVKYSWISLYIYAKISSPAWYVPVTPNVYFIKCKFVSIIIRALLDIQRIWLFQLPARITKKMKLKQKKTMRNKQCECKNECFRFESFASLFLVLVQDGESVCRR